MTAREVTERLQVVARAASGGRARAACETMLDRLRAPARIGIVGLPGSGKRALLRALSGVALEAEDLPTLELKYGPEARTRATLADGSLLDIAGLPARDLLAQGPVFLEIEASSEMLGGRSLLMVACEADLGDAASALAWASARVDICLWCSRRFPSEEAALWSAAPGPLRNHGVLVLAEGDGPAQAPFEAVFRTADPAGAADVARHLAAVVDEAREQDLHAARLLLHRYGEGVPDIRTPPPLSPSATPAARAELARLFSHLRGAADGLRHRLTGDGTADVLEATETVLETLAGRALRAEHLDETWPHLAPLLGDARDLALLLRIEGGPAQAADAARLMLQVRYDMETLLAA